MSDALDAAVYTTAPRRHYRQAPLRRWRNRRRGGRAMDRITRILQVLRILDEKGQLSLTNLMLFGSLLNLYAGPGTSDLIQLAVQQLGPLALAVWNYIAKRKITQGAADQAAVMGHMLASLQQAAAAAQRNGGGPRLVPPAPGA